jgi:hypothetical protein
MKRQTIVLTNKPADTATSEKLATTSPPHDAAGFIDSDELLRRVPISKGTLKNYRDAGKIPFVRLAGRRVIFHWPSVEASLLREQRGGIS